jgi:molybdopterin converting factor small subunit
VVGAASVEVDLEPGSNAEQLIDQVVTQHPALETALLDQSKRLHTYLKMFINGREVVYLEGQFQHVIQPTDTVDIFPPVGGG